MDTTSTVNAQASDTINSKNGSNTEEGDNGTADTDTSSWESEPNTARSSRKYHPVKGEQTAMADDDNDDQEALVNGIAPDDPNLGDPELLSSQYLRKTFGLGELERSDSHQTSEVQETNLNQSNHEKAEDTEIQNGFQRDGQSSDDDWEMQGETGSDHSYKRDEQGADDVIEELDLTKEPKSDFLGRGQPGMPHAQFVLMPSLGTFGSSPFESLMTGLMSSVGDGFENDADVSSQSEAEEERRPRGRPQLAPELDGKNQQERWEHLFGLLEQQHRQQVILQREHHERQVQLLQMQLARLSAEQEDLITKQHQEPLGHGSKTRPTGKATTDESSPRQGDDPDDPEKQLRRSPNGKEGAGNRDRNAASPATNSSEQDPYSASGMSGDSDATLEGSLEDASETLMTTWSDVVEQKQADMDKGRASHQEEEERSESDTKKGIFQGQRTHTDGAGEERFMALKKHFAQQQKQLQEQYAIQLRSMQQQWVELQQQQQEQQEVLRHLLARQRERITQTNRDLQGLTHGREGQELRDADLGEEDRGTPTSDDTSTTYSDFTYWKQAEQDTYKALPDLAAEDATRDQSPKSWTAQGQRSPQEHVYGSELTDGQPSAVTGHASSVGQRSLDPTDQWLANGVGQRSPQLSGQSSSPRRSADDVDIEDAQLTSSLRLNLREKHARHIADLKAYYDSEIQELQAKLTEAASLRDHSPYKVMTRTNQRLQNHCVKLEAALKSANSRIEDLENAVKALEARLGDTYNSTDSFVASLQQKVSDLKQLCRHKERDIQSLGKKNRELQASLDQAYQLQDIQALDEHREQKILKRVLAEYKALAERHEITKELLHDTETQLYESKAKIADLTRTLSRLEFEVKRMDLDSSSLKRQSLSMSLSGTSLRSDTSPNAAVTSTLKSPQANDHAQGQNQTLENLKDISGIQNISSTTVSSVTRSVEERKFLKPSADYNMFTGEELMTSESESLSLRSASETESNLTQSEEDRANMAAPDHHSNLQVPFDTDTDEERPLSPMMKAARQLDAWKAEESMNAGNTKGLLEGILNGTKVAGRQEDISQRTSSLTKNHSTNNFSHSRDRAPLTRGRLDGGPMTSDASIHIWPPSEKTSKRSPVLAGSPKLGTTLAHSSPKQLARQSLAKAIKPKDHDLFPVRGVKDSPPETSKGGSPSGARQALVTASSAVGSRKVNESPRRRLFVEEKKNDDKGRLKGGIASLHAALDGENVADSVLAKVRAGQVKTRADWEGPTSSTRRSYTPKSQIETGHDIIRRINDHQKKLDQLMMEKRELETTLSHVPMSGRVSRRSRQEEERLEQRLEQVTRELGSVRMLLRKYNALKSSI